MRMLLLMCVCVYVRVCVWMSTYIHTSIHSYRLIDLHAHDKYTNMHACVYEMHCHRMKYGQDLSWHVMIMICLHFFLLYFLVDGVLVDVLPSEDETRAANKRVVRHIHTQLHANTHTRTHTQTHTCAHNGRVVRHTYGHTYTHAWMHTRIHTYTHTRTHTHTHTMDNHGRALIRTNIHTHLHAHTRAHTRTHTHTQNGRVMRHTYVHTCTHTYMHTHTKTQTRTLSHTYTHTHTHTHSQTKITFWYDWNYLLYSSNPAGKIHNRESVHFREYKKQGWLYLGTENISNLPIWAVISIHENFSHFAQECIFRTRILQRRINDATVIKHFQITFDWIEHQYYNVPILQCSKSLYSDWQKSNLSIVRRVGNISLGV